MSDLHILSFRDLAVRKGGAVTPAVWMRVPEVDGEFDWGEGLNRTGRMKNSIRVLSDASISHLVTGQHVRFVVHGFNVSRDAGFSGAGALAQELAGMGYLPGEPDGEADLIVPVLWPGDWVLPAINYPFEFRDARDTAVQFAGLLQRCFADVGAISFVTHSFGVRVVLETVRKILDIQPEFNDVFHAATFMAAADDNNVLDEAQYRDAVAAFTKITIVASRADRVLKYAFPLGDIVEAALWRNQRTFKRALGLIGPVFKLESEAEAKTLTYKSPKAPRGGHDHGDYLPYRGDKQKEDENGWSPRRREILSLLRVLPTQPPDADGWLK